MVAPAKTGLWHRILTHYLPIYFPKADRFHRSSRGDSFLAFLQAFHSPHMIAAMDKDAFVEAAWPVIGRRVGKAALLAVIYETSKSSVAFPVAPDSDAIRIFRLILAQARSLVQQRNTIEEWAPSFSPTILTIASCARSRESAPSMRSPFWPRPATCAASAFTANSLSSAAWTWPLFSQGSSGGASQALEVWQRPTAPHALDSGAGRSLEACQQLPRQVRALHRAGPAQPRPAPQGLHSNCCEGAQRHSRRDQVRRTLSPLFRGGEPRPKDLSHLWPRRGVMRTRR